MKNIRFERDHQKSQSNKKKHAVSFEDAQSVFLDPNARIISARKAAKQETTSYEDMIL